MPIILAPSLVTARQVWADWLGPYQAGNSSGDWSNFTVRQLIPMSAVSGSGSRFRVVLTAPDAYPTDFAETWIGQQAASGDWWDFDGNQVQALFGGSASVSLAAGETVESDDIVIDLNDSTGIVVGIHFGSGTPQVPRAGGYASDFKHAWPANRGTNSAGNTAPSMYGSSTNAVYGVDVVRVYSGHSL